MNQPAERTRFSESGGDNTGGAGGAPDVEGMARRAGWKPKDDWVKDGNSAEKWVDASVFVERVLSGYDKRGQDRYRAMDSRLAAQERTIQQMSTTIQESAKVMTEFQEYHLGVAKREYERAKREIEAKMRTAVKDADPEAHDAARAELAELEKTKPADPPPADKKPANQQQQQPQPDPTIVEWNKDNLWYNPTGMDEVSMWATGYFNTLPSTMSLQEKLEKVSERAQVKFPDETKGKVSGKYVRDDGGDDRRRSGRVADPDIDGDGDGGGGKQPKGRRFEDLPKDAQEQCRRFEKMMVKDPKTGKDRPFVSREQYLADYDWG